MNESRVGRSDYSYRDVLVGLYYNPFIREAPESDDLWDVDELAGDLEVFLWVDWSKQRDTNYWLERINLVTESNVATPAVIAAAEELKTLNPVLERFDRCGVRREFITQGMTALGGYRFLNILWVRQLGRRYQGTLLGDLLERQAEGSNVPVPISRRPRSYPVM